jgi:5-methylcytosine-specific restriction protein A
MQGTDARSARAEAYRALYRTPEWRKLRKAQLARQPLCEFCLRLSRQTPATIVDHRQRHRGDRGLFFDPANLDSLCDFHHNSTKQRMERGKVIIGVDADGWPVSR